MRQANRKILCFTSTCALSLAASAYTGAQYLWTGSGDGTTLNRGANWNKSGAAPGAPDSAQFYTTGTLDLTADEDFQPAAERRPACRQPGSRQPRLERQCPG